MTYQISRLIETHVNVNFSFLSKDNIKNITFNELNIADLNTNLSYNKNYYNYHLISIYSILTFGIFIITLIIIVYFKNKKTLDSTDQEKVVSPNTLETNSSDIDNNIPNEALKLAKKARKDKNNSK